jgi:hypothetical protein
MYTDRWTKLLLTLILVVLIAFFVRSFFETPPVLAEPGVPLARLVALGGVSPGVTAAALLDPYTGDVWLLSINPATLKPILERRGRVEVFISNAANAR